jgi:hypothetical protein
MSSDQQDPPPQPPLTLNPEANLSPNATTQPQPIPRLPYLVEWASYDPATTIPQALHHTLIPDLLTLLTLLATTLVYSLSSNNPLHPTTTTTTTTNSHDEEEEQDQQDEYDQKPPFHRLLIFPHGLHHRHQNPQQRELLDALLAGGVVEEMDIDPAFVQCLATRRPYRPAAALKRLAWRRGMGRSAARVRAEMGRRGMFSPADGGGLVWEYPEVVELGVGYEGVVAAAAAAGLGVPSPVVRALPGGRAGKGIGVVFCRAGFWGGREGSVLFLEKGVLERAGKIGAEGEVTESLEDVVVEAIREGWEPEDQLPGVIAEAVRHRWLELFDFLELQPQTLCDKTLACYLQMIRSLELNCEGEDEVDWRPLIARIQRRLELFSTLRDRRPVLRPPTWNAKPAKTPDVQKQMVASRTDTMRSVVSKRGQDLKKPIDENQRALDRLSYLGGILIPLPLISGILSMGDVYGPGGSKFFIFWAVAIPLAGLTVLLVHADTIRKGEVWVEVGADRVMPHPEVKGEASTEESIDPFDVQGKKGGSVTGRKHPVSEDEGPPSPRQRVDVPFVVDHDVEERIIGMPPAATTISMQPEGVEGLPRRARWSMGWGQVPTLILEKPADGGQPKAWRREQLGWAGAIQAILYKKFRHGSDVPEGVAASERSGRRTSNPY